MKASTGIGRRFAKLRDVPTWHAAWAPLPDIIRAVDGATTTVERVYLVPFGPVPGARAMAEAPLPDGWTARDHHLDERTPVWRFTGPGGRNLTIMASPTWWGNEPATVAQSAAAWETLEGIIADVWQGGRLLSTPGATGLDLLRRSLPAEERYPTLNLEHQELIRSFAGQGRIEPAGAAWGELGRRFPGGLPRLEVWDARLAYAAVCWGLSSGSPVSDHEQDWPKHQQGFAMCRVTVPDGWSHVGLIGVRGGDGWRWPSSPGEQLEVWLHGAEIWLCREWGWRVEILERLWFPTSGKPLQKFADRIVRARARITSSGPVARLVRAGLRAIMLHTIGRLHGRPPVIVRSVPIADAAHVPDSAADLHMRDGVIRWTEQADEAHDRAASHPEWSAAIWARARCRLLDAPGAAHEPEDRQGALYLPPSSIVALRVDAIWTTCSPRWGDDGRPGRYTLRAEVPGPLPTPTSLGQLLALAADR